MINAILSFSVRQRMLVFLATVVLTGFGVLALKHIPIDAFPDVTNVQVQVLATAGGMSPPEVEKLVTRPIEIQMGGLPRLTEIRSVSKIGLAAITIVFEDGVNDYFARQLVSERLASAREKLTHWRGCRTRSHHDGPRRDISNTRWSAIIRRNTTRRN